MADEQAASSKLRHQATHKASVGRDASRARAEERRGGAMRGGDAGEDWAMEENAWVRFLVRFLPFDDVAESSSAPRGRPRLFFLRFTAPSSLSSRRPI